MNYIETKKIIPSAFNQGLLKPQREANICLKASINQTNFLLYLLLCAGETGMSTDQIVGKIKFNENTCRCYLRELVKLQIVERYRSGRNVAIWTLKEKQAF